MLDTGLLSLRLWQMPLAIAGVLLLISGPSMLLAAFKLSRRNLAPLLDANGWAINTRARINIPFGTSLTDHHAVAQLATSRLRRAISQPAVAGSSVTMHTRRPAPAARHRRSTSSASGTSGM